MTQPILRAEGIGKKYLLRPDKSVLLALAHRTRPRELWALQALDFEVVAGEILAVIGRNGAGKSTLLKLAAGVTMPTIGRVHRPQRIAPLIEVGAGFHPELSGRDNVEVNGRLLGLSRREVVTRFDEIVAFAELEHAIDQPIKEYSSGMFMRLGFSVAVHTNPELLVVDEVLAVGDMAFQARCLAHIKQMRGEGVGVLFVSHNEAAVMELASRAIFLERGEAVRIGEVNEVVAAYHASVPASHRQDDAAPPTTSDIVVRVRGIDDGTGGLPVLWKSGQPAVLRCELEAIRDVGAGICGLRVNKQGYGLVAAWHPGNDRSNVPPMRRGEIVSIDIRLDLNLTPGTYHVDIAVLAQDMTAVYVESVGVATFTIESRSAVAGVAHLNPRVEIVDSNQ